MTETLSTYFTSSKREKGSWMHHAFKCHPVCLCCLCWGWARGEGQPWFEMSAVIRLTPLSHTTCFYSIHISHSFPPWWEEVNMAAARWFRWFGADYQALSDLKWNVLNMLIYWIKDFSMLMGWEWMYFLSYLLGLALRSSVSTNHASCLHKMFSHSVIYAATITMETVILQLHWMSLHLLAFCPLSLFPLNVQCVYVDTLNRGMWISNTSAWQREHPVLCVFICCNYHPGSRWRGTASVSECGAGSR